MKWTWIGLGLGSWIYLMLAADLRQQPGGRRFVTTLLAVAIIVTALMLPDGPAPLISSPIVVLILALLLLMLWVGASDGQQAAARAVDPDRLDEDDAYSVLGLAPGASAAAVKDAHRRLMKQYHPDYGGTVEIAARINAARERLLRQPSPR